MAIHLIDKNSITPITAGDADGLWVVADDRYIATTEDAISTSEDQGNRSFQIFGHVSSQKQSGLESASNFGLQVGMHGTVYGGQAGVISNAIDATGSVENQGTISGGVGINANVHDLRIENDGEIAGYSTVGIYSSAAHTDIRNHGAINGYTAAIHTAGDLSLINQGSIFSGTTAIKAAHGDVTITNVGVINGDVRLGAGNDRIDSVDGTIHGFVDLGSGSDSFLGDGSKGAFQVSGGSGDDHYSITGASYSIIEGAGDGYDDVTISSNYTLPLHVEALYLSGAGDFDGTGNDGRNSLTGNDGDNALRGMTLNDYLEGLGGDDLLNGGRGNDTAIFSGQGTLTVNLMKGYAQSAVTGHDSLLSIENVLAFAGNNILIGDNSHNILNAANGDSRQTGNGGRDTFVFGYMTHGTHVITDFEDGIDRIKILTGQDAWSSYEALSSHIAQQGDDVLISVDNGKHTAEIRLLHTDLVEINAADFHFT